MTAPARSLSPLVLPLALALTAAACSGPIPNRDPVGQPFPSVAGTSLEGETVHLPSDLSGEPAVLLVGYLQEAQFDIDRWLLGLLQAEVDVPILEIPTLPGLGATVVSDWIDDGMRSGIPSEDWGLVVTVYGDAAEPIAELTGTERGRNARALLLDAGGRIVWFHDRGYSARLALELLDEVQAAREGGPGAR